MSEDPSDRKIAPQPICLLTPFATSFHSRSGMSKLMDTAHCQYVACRSLYFVASFINSMSPVRSLMAFNSLTTDNVVYYMDMVENVSLFDIVAKGLDVDQNRTSYEG